MADQPIVKQEPTLEFSRKRVHAILAALEAAAAGDYSKLPLSEAEDELDAIAHATNVLVDELRLLRARLDGLSKDGISRDGISRDGISKDGIS